MTAFLWWLIKQAGTFQFRKEVTGNSREIISGIKEDDREWLRDASSTRRSSDHQSKPLKAKSKTKRWSSLHRKVCKLLEIFARCVISILLNRWTITYIGNPLNRKLSEAERMLALYILALFLYFCRWTELDSLWLFL